MDETQDYGDIVEADPGTANKVWPYMLGYGGALGAGFFGVYGAFKKVFRRSGSEADDVQTGKWLMYFGLFFIIMAALVAGSRMHNPESGCLGKTDATWLPFVFAVLGTGFIFGGCILACIKKKSDDTHVQQQGLPPPQLQARSGPSYYAHHEPLRAPPQLHARHQSYHHQPPPGSGRRLLQEKFDPTGLPTTLGVLLLICFLSYLYFKGSPIPRKSVHKVYIVKKPPTFLQGK